MMQTTANELKSCAVPGLKGIWADRLNYNKQQQPDCPKKTIRETGTKESKKLTRSTTSSNASLASNRANRQLKSRVPKQQNTAMASYASKQNMTQVHPQGTDQLRLDDEKRLNNIRINRMQDILLSQKYGTFCYACGRCSYPCSNCRLCIMFGCPNNFNDECECY